MSRASSTVTRPRSAACRNSVRAARASRWMAWAGRRQAARLTRSGRQAVGLTHSGTPRPIRRSRLPQTAPQWQASQHQEIDAESRRRKRRPRLESLPGVVEARIFSKPAWTGGRAFRATWAAAAPIGATVAPIGAGIALIGAAPARIGTTIAPIRATLALIGAKPAPIGVAMVPIGAGIPPTGATIALIGAKAAPIGAMAAPWRRPFQRPSSKARGAPSRPREFSPRAISVPSTGRAVPALILGLQRRPVSLKLAAWYWLPRSRGGRHSTSRLWRRSACGCGLCARATSTTTPRFMGTAKSCAT